MNILGVLRNILKKGQGFETVGGAESPSPGSSGPWTAQTQVGLFNIH